MSWDRDGASAVSRGAMTVDEASSSFAASLPRTTASARPAHRSARGLEAVLVSLDKRTQNACKQLIVERLELEARKRTILDRLVSGPAAGSSAPLPDILFTINAKIGDNDASIRRVAGSAAPVLLDALKDPSLVSSLGLEVGSEEDAGEGEAARLWRRQLDTKRVNRSERTHVSHDSPTVTGDRSLTAGTSDDASSLSYYQKQQLKYGRGRRGSTSIAGTQLRRVTCERLRVRAVVTLVSCTLCVLVHVAGHGCC